MPTRIRIRICAATCVAAIAAMIAAPGIRSQSVTTTVTDAPTGFALVSNGFAEEFCARQDELVSSPNSPKIPEDECSFDIAAEEFTGPETVADGLGPIFNGNGCGECHLVPVLGGSSQVVERRAGFDNGVEFNDHPGGSLIQDRATDPSIQELVIPTKTSVIAMRASVSILGDGFVEAIANRTLRDIAAAQPAAVRGTILRVPVGENPGSMSIGRFGWKNQQASLTSFSADAYVNEMGITSPLEMVEPTSNGNPITLFDPLPEPDDEGVDVELFALFMRSTLAPPRDDARAATTAAQRGSQIFDNIGCSTCHTREIVTAPPGTPINGGAMVVSNALGNKRIRPFGDFLLHDVGTGDGIEQNGGYETRNMVRTVPLWGVRARGRFMHDGLSFSLQDAIFRHGNQAQAARDAYFALTIANQDRLVAFLKSL